ncbi:MAG: hypothetical protein AAGJ35_15125, partial [Myxococcota bacterium]
MNLQHIMEECEANERIVAKRNKLRKFHVRTTQTEQMKNDTVLINMMKEDDGKERIAANTEIKWQRMLIPVG